MKWILIFLVFLSTCHLKGQAMKDTSRIMGLIKTAHTICENEPQRTIQLGMQALKLAREEQYLNGEINALNIIGVGYDISSNYDSALYYYKAALANFKHLNNPSLKASIYNNFGLTYWNVSDYKQAIINYHQALDIFKRQSDHKGMAKTYNNLGLLYQDMLDAETAIAHYQNAVTYYKKVNDSSGISVAYLNIGSAYDSKNDYQSAEFYYQKSYHLKHADDYYGRSIVLLDWAQLKNELHQEDSALVLIQHAIRLKEEVNDVNGLITAYNVLANIYKLLHEYNNSIQAAKQALVLNKTIRSKRRLIKSYGLLKYSFLYSHQPDSAMRYNDLEYALKDSIFSENLSDAIAAEKVKYTTLSVEKENLELRLNNEQQRFTLKMLLLTFGFVLTVTGLILFFYNRSRKNKLLIQKQQQQAIWDKLIYDTEQAERARIARDLHDSVGQKLSVLKMRLSIRDADVNKSSLLLDESIQEVRNISHNLLPFDMNKGLCMTIEELTEQINFIAPDTKITLHIADLMKQAVIPKQVELIVYRVVQEITTNALKYAHAKNIYIYMDLEERRFKLEVSDDGIGFNTASITEGIGLKNIHDRIMQLHGTVNLQSNEQTGTRFQIEIPL